MSSITGMKMEVRSPRLGLAFINLGSLLAQIVQVAGYPTLLTLALAQVDYPSWVIGSVLALQWAVVLFFAPFVPKRMDRFGVKRTSQGGAIASLFGLIILLLSDSIWAVVASALFMGAGLTVRWVACDTWIVHAVEPRARGRAIGIHETLMGLGIAIGPLLTMMSEGNESRALLIYGALLALSVTSFAYGSRPATDSEPPEETQGSILRLVVSALALALIAALASGYVETAMVALLPLYLISFDYPAAHALGLLSIFGLGGTVLQTPLGWIADRWGFRAGQFLCVALVIAGGIFLITSIGMPWAVAVVLFVWGGCVGGLNTLAVIEAGSTLHGSASGTGMAFIASAYTLGGVVGPTISGMTFNVANGHGAILTIVALMVVYGSALMAGAKWSRYRQPKERQFQQPER